MRNPDRGKRYPALAWTGLDPGCVRRQFEVGQPDLGLVARGRTVGADRAGVGQQAEIAGRNQLQIDREPRAAQRGVAAHGRARAVRVPVGHPHHARGGVRGQDDQPVRAHAGAAVAQPGDAGRGPFVEARRAPVEEDEIVPRAGHLVNDGPSHRRPARAWSRSHQTIQIASRTMRLFILLWPSTRSVKTIGISTSRNPFFQARKLISIWKE